MKNKEKELLFQLLRNSKLSDREIAKKLKTSQSTITRNRHKLENRFIKSYTVVPDLSKLNINMIAFTFANFSTPTPDLMKKISNFIEEEKNVVFAGHGEGMRKTGIIVSFHKDFSDLTEYMKNIRLLCEGFSDSVETFIVSTNKLFKTLSMANAVEELVNNEIEKNQIK